MAEDHKWFLKEMRVYTGMRTYCGAFAAVCPYSIIEFDESGPKRKEECHRKGEGVCKDVCQRVMTDASHISMNVFNFKVKPHHSLDCMKGWLLQGPGESNKQNILLKGAGWCS